MCERERERERGFGVQGLGSTQVCVHIRGFARVSPLGLLLGVRDVFNVCLFAGVVG